MKLNQIRFTKPTQPNPIQIYFKSNNLKKKGRRKTFCKKKSVNQLIQPN